MPVKAQDSAQSIGRGTPNAWSPASDGQSWNQLNGASTMSVVTVSGLSRLALNGTTGANVMVLGSTTTTSIDLFARFWVTNTNDNVGLIGRVVNLNTYYRAEFQLIGTQTQLRLIYTTGGVTTVLASLNITETAQTFYWLHLRIVGSGTSPNMVNDLSVNWWADGNVEPITGGYKWMLNATDTNIQVAGKFGVYGKGNNGTHFMYFDGFYASDSLIYSTDSFLTSTGRGTPNAWSPGLDLQNWTPLVLVGAGTLSVATYNSLNRGALTNSTVANVISVGNPAASPGTAKLLYDVDLLCRLNVGATTDSIGLFGRSNAAGTTYYRCDFVSNQLRLVYTHGGTDTVLQTAVISESINTYYWVHFIIRGFSTAQNMTSNLMANWWADGGSEPAGFMVSAADSNIQSIGCFGVYGKPNSGTDVLTYDSFVANEAPPPATSPANNIANDRPYGITRFWPNNMGAPPLLDTQTITDLVGPNSASATGWNNGVWIREQLQWRNIEQQGQQFPQLFNWAVIDDMIARFNYNGINVCVCLQGAPNWWTTIEPAGGTNVGNNNGQLPDPTAFALFGKAFAQRYNGTAGWGTAQAGQIENEQFDSLNPRDLQGQWLSVAANAVYPVIKKFYPTCRVGLCAVRKLPTGSVPHINAWLTGLFTYLGGVGTNFDWLDFHYYRDNLSSADPNVDIPASGPNQGNDTPSVKRELGIIQGFIATYHPGAQVWCGEVGWNIYDDGGGSKTTLSSALTAGTNYTALPVANTTQAMPAGTPITVGYGNSSTQEAGVYAYGANPSGSVSVGITADSTGMTQIPWHPANNHSIGESVYGQLSNFVSLATQSAYLKEVYDAMRLNGGTKALVFTIVSNPNVTSSTIPQWSTAPKSLTQNIPVQGYTYEPAYSMTATDSTTYPTWTSSPTSSAGTVAMITKRRDGAMVANRRDGLMTTQRRG